MLNDNFPDILCTFSIAANEARAILEPFFDSLAKVSDVGTISEDKTDDENPVAKNAAMTNFLCSIQPSPTLHSIPGGGGVRGQPEFIPTTTEGLNAFVAALQNQGPVTSVPLPHHVHDEVAGWLPTRPRDSPTIEVQYSVDRPAYAQLHLPLPRLSAGHHPGRSGTTHSVADTGAQRTVVP